VFGTFSSCAIALIENTRNRSPKAFAENECIMLKLKRVAKITP
jgi:hypothetical protein